MKAWTRTPYAQVLIVVVAAIAVGVFLVTVPTFREFFDLGVYRGAVRSWLIDGGELYDFLYQDTEYGFTYPPFAALVFSPLALTTWPVAVAGTLSPITIDPARCSRSTVLACIPATAPTSA